jgi:hypothetical protein
MSKEIVKSLIDLVPDADMDIIYKIVVKFIPEVTPEQDELEAFAEAKADTTPTVSHDAINWD